MDGLLEQNDVQATLLRWVADVVGGPVTDCVEIAGGNRCRSWAVDIAGTRLYLRYQPPRPPSAEPYTVWREATIYRALLGSDVPAPRLIAVHKTHQAILTELMPGRADYRRICDHTERTAIAQEFVAALTVLHRMDITGRDLPGLAPGSSIADCVRREIAIWRAMYVETNRADPLIDIAFDWIERNLPDPEGRPVLVHGDAGPGNFLFERGHLTALLDWELAHAGDPMEDLAWFSMRNVMEPVPDFGRCIAKYGEHAGQPADLPRIRYHRVLVSLRVVIIRHRNVTGLPGNSIVSRALNRRLLMEAIADASGISLQRLPPLDAPDTERTWLFDAVLADLRDNVAGATDEPRIVATAKNAAKVIKYLRDGDRLMGLIEAEDITALAGLLGSPPASAAAGQISLLAALKAGHVGFEPVIRFFARSTARAAELAASASGGLARRHFPSLESDPHA